MGPAETTAETTMSEPNDIPDIMKRVVLPPRRRFSESPPKVEGVVTGPAKKTLSKLPTARPPLATPPQDIAFPIQPQQAAPISPPPGIAPVSNIPQPLSFASPPVQVRETIKDVAEPEQEKFTPSQAPSLLTNPDPDSHFEENGVPPVGEMSPIPVYLSLAASLIALGIQIWMLLSAHSSG